MGESMQKYEKKRGIPGNDEFFCVLPGGICGYYKMLLKKERLMLIILSIFFIFVGKLIRTAMVENFIIWYDSMDAQLQFYWACALISSALFLVQLVLMITGMDFSDMDIDVDVPDADTGFSLVSIKSLITFFLGLGWAGVSLWNMIPNRMVLALVGMSVGVLFMLVFFFLLKQVLKLEHDGSYKLADSVGKVADVYVPIPEDRTGMGKVQLSLNGSVLEFNALTDGSRLATGQKVRVREVINNDTLLVESL